MTPLADHVRWLPEKSRPLWLTLAFWTIPALVFLLAAGLWRTTITLRDLSDSAYDRSLAGAIRAIDLNVSTASGGVGVELPYPYFESFQATANGEVYFRVSTDDGLVQIGDALLPAPPPLAVNEIRFFDATYFGTPVRVGAYKRPLDGPLYGAPEAQNIVIEVAETTGSRKAFRNSLLARAIWRDGLTIFAAVAFLALGARRALRPLSALGERLERRDPDDRTQIEALGLPREVRPLVDAVNRLLARHREQGEAQRRFIDDASHQLKTPIAVLRSQVDYGLGAADPQARREALEAMRPILDRAARITAQLLALARARNAALLGAGACELVPIGDLLDDVARLHLGTARKRRIALEVELPDGQIAAIGSEALLFEAISNLLDNAVRHSPAGGTVLLRGRPVSGASMIEVEVADEGLGMDAAKLAEVGERFRTASPQVAPEAAGSGLGLSIVLAIVKGQGGTLDLANRKPAGMSATIRLPPAKAQQAAAALSRTERRLKARTS